MSFPPQQNMGWSPDANPTTPGVTGSAGVIPTASGGASTPTPQMFTQGQNFQNLGALGSLMAANPSAQQNIMPLAQWQQSADYAKAIASGWDPAALVNMRPVSSLGQVQGTGNLATVGTSALPATGAGGVPNLYNIDAWGSSQPQPATQTQMNTPGSLLPAITNQTQRLTRSPFQQMLGK